MPNEPIEYVPELWMLTVNVQNQYLIKKIADFLIAKYGGVKLALAMAEKDDRLANWRVSDEIAGRDLQRNIYHKAFNIWICCRQPRKSPGCANGPNTA